MNYSTCNELNYLKTTLELNYKLCVRTKISTRIINIWKDIYKKTLDRKKARFDNNIDNVNDKSTYDHSLNL